MDDKTTKSPITRSISIRRLLPSDSFADLTEFLHRAYGAHVKAGRKYLATHQDATVTRDRVNKGECYVANEDWDCTNYISVIMRKKLKQ